MNAEQSDFIELQNDLDATPETESLQTEILNLWNQHDQCVQKIAPLLYELCITLNAQGKKGQGFKIWLKIHGKSPTTAYRWIHKYCQIEQKELPFQTKEPTSKALAIPALDDEDSETATSSQMTRGADVRTLDEAKQTLSSFLNKFEKEVRSKYAADLIVWLMEVSK